MALTAAYLTRPILGGGNLSVAAAPFQLAAAELDPGALTWRRQMVTSPFVAGAIEVNAVKDIAKGQCAVIVTGANAATIQTNLATIIAAFTQSTYELHITISGSDYGWTCFRADYGVVFDFPLSNNARALAKFQFPRKPVQVAGPV